MVADANGDGKPDIVVANWCQSSPNCPYGNGDGTFQKAATYDSGGFSTNSYGAVSVADVNGDGKPDIVVANTRY